MDFVLAVTAFLLGLTLIFGDALKKYTKSCRPVITPIGLHQSEDGIHYLSTLRRELANYLIWTDPDQYVSIYKLAHDEILSFQCFASEEIAFQLSRLTERFPYCASFDILATREYILYGDAFRSHSYEEIKDRYVNIIRFQALTVVARKGWQQFRATSDVESTHILDYARRVKDTQFQSKLRCAINEFLHSQKIKNVGEMAIFHNIHFAVKSVIHSGEVRYGIHLKQTGEYGLYAFSCDDNGDRTNEHFYRSDATFSLEQPLDSINGTEQVQLIRPARTPARHEGGPLPLHGSWKSRTLRWCVCRRLVRRQRSRPNRSRVYRV